MKILFIILLIAWSFFGAGLYGVAGRKLTREREPWFTLTMLLGLAFSIYIASLVSGATPQMGAWIFAPTALCYLGLRWLFGKNSSIEMFIAPHVLAILLVLLLPGIQNARAKSQMQSTAPTSQAANPSTINP